MINNAEQVYMLVTGGEKAKIVSRVLCEAGSYEDYPAAHVRPLTGNLSWFLDGAAGRLLESMKNPGRSRGRILPWSDPLAVPGSVEVHLGAASDHYFGFSLEFAHQSRYPDVPSCEEGFRESVDPPGVTA